MPGLPDERPDLLSYCTRCGNKVTPYRASNLSLRLAYDRDQEPPEDLLMAEPHYWCGRCSEHWLANSPFDTGMDCECGTFNPMRSKHCGGCGRAL